MQELLHSKKDRLTLSLRRRQRMAIYLQNKTPLLLLQQLSEKCLKQIQKQQGSRQNIKQLLQQAVSLQQSMEESQKEGGLKIFRISCCLLLSQKSQRNQKWYLRLLLKLILIGIYKYSPQQSNFTCRLLNLALRSLKKKAILFFLQQQKLLQSIIQLSLLPQINFLSWIAKVTALSAQVSLRMKPYVNRLFELVQKSEDAQTTILNLIKCKQVISEQFTVSWLKRAIEKREIERVGRIVRAYEEGGQTLLLDQFSQIIYSGE